MSVFPFFRSGDADASSSPLLTAGPESSLFLLLSALSTRQGISLGGVVNIGGERQGGLDSDGRRQPDRRSLKASSFTSHTLGRPRKVSATGLSSHTEVWPRSDQVVDRVAGGDGSGGRAQGGGKTATFSSGSCARASGRQTQVQRRFALEEAESYVGHSTRGGSPAGDNQDGKARRLC